MTETLSTELEGWLDGDGEKTVGGLIDVFLAPPFTGLDTLPALGVVLLSLAVLLEDFAIVIVALIAIRHATQWSLAGI